LQICRNLCYDCDDMPLENRLYDTLKRHGYSVTKPRLAVFEALSKGEPLTMAGLTAAISSRTDRASVYRTVELFEKLGIIVRLNQGWKYKLELSDLFTPHHHHLTCTNCGKTVAFDEPEQLGRMIRDLAENSGFMAQTHLLEISGLCADCRTGKHPATDKNASS